MTRDLSLFGLFVVVSLPGLWPSSAVLNFGFVFSFREIDRAELQLCFVATRSSWHPSQCHGGCQKRHWRDGTAIKTRCLEFKSDWKNAWRLFEHVSRSMEKNILSFLHIPFPTLILMCARFFALALHVHEPLTTTWRIQGFPATPQLGWKNVGLAATLIFMNYSTTIRIL